MVTEVTICFDLSESSEESLCKRLRMDTFREKLLSACKRDPALATTLPEIQSYW